MSNEDKGHMPQSSLWSSSEMAEHWQQDVERRRQDLAEATQRMLESAGLGPGDHVLDIAAGPGGPRLFGAQRGGTGGSPSAKRKSTSQWAIPPPISPRARPVN